jgi:ESS family glutamate:Na+ symporter
VFESLTEAQWVGFSFVLLGIALICGMLVRKAVPWLAAVYIPTSVLAGLLILLAGPQALGEVTNGWSLIPAQTVPVLSALPGLLINVVFGGIMIGKALPSMRRIRHDAAPHAILGGVFSFGQFAIGGLAVTLLLTPVFGLPDAAGSIIEISFAGGHGTIAGWTGCWRRQVPSAGYGYKQLFYEPFLGGGILTALSVPIILGIGSLTFGIASAAATAGLITWGVVRNRRP